MHRRIPDASTELGRLAIRAGLVIFYGGIVLGTILMPGKSMAAEPAVEKDGTIHVPAFDLPESSFLSEESRAILKHARDSKEGLAGYSAGLDAGCPRMEGADLAHIAAIRKCHAEAFYKTAFYKAFADYHVVMTPKEMGGVFTESYVPATGVAPQNAKRVLINLHGGGSRNVSYPEVAPIASVGKIRVISIDYRTEPQHPFPVANEDVAAVYRELLKTYEPKNIGMYGCSAGGALTSQSMAWFQKEKLPLPGAIGLFCYGAGRALDGAADKWIKSDSAYFTGALTGINFAKFYDSSREKASDRRNPLMSPGDYDEVMAKFPPTLLIGGTREFLLSAIVVTHAQLQRLGVDAELHVWEGMEHGFFVMNPKLAESREAYDVIAKFFERHLGR